MADRPEPVREPASGSSLALLDLVDVPILVVSAAPLAVQRVNAAARRLFGARLADRLPAGVEVIGGPAAPAILAEAIAAADAGADTHLRREPVVVTCQAARGVVDLCFAPARMPERAGLWLMTLTPAPPPPPGPGDWRTNLEVIMDLLPVGLEVYDENLKGLFFNRLADELFLYDGQAIMHFDDWFERGFPDPDERVARLAEWRRLVDAARRDPGLVQSVEWAMHVRSGERRVMRFLFRFVAENFVLAQWDVTEQRMLEAELRRLAQSDPLTGIRNRRAFFEAAEAAFAASLAADDRLALLILDIDRFKAINDRYGHPAGDTVIRTIAERCAAVLRDGDIIARIGGEEFAVLLTATELDVAQATAGRLLDAVAASPIVADGMAIPVRISIGATTCAAADESFIAMMARADAALYEAKNGGRGRVVTKGPAG